MDLVKKEIVATNISFRGVLYTSFLLLLVLSLFFIPEIVKLQERFTGGAKTTSPVTTNELVQSSTVEIEEILPPAGARSDASLDGIWSLVQGGYLEGRGQQDLSVGAPSATTDGPNLLQDRLLLERTLGQGSVTWEQLTSKDVKSAFRSAQNRAIKILKGLSERQSAVRFALVNYINGLAWITRGDRKLMSADEALAYIEQLDINVTQAMLQSEIDAVDFEAWKQVSFGSISGSSRAAAFKLNRSVSFNPRMNLIDVEIERQSDWITRRNGEVRQRKNPRSSVRVAGFVIGKDTRRITVFRNGRRINDIRVSRKDTEEGLRSFRFRHKRADGVFTLRAVSKTGEIYEKSYVFLGKVFQRFRQDEDGVYLLPFGQQDAEALSLRNLDTRLDRFFRVNIRGDSSGAEARGFDTF